MLLSLADARRVLFVGGKGGVGKTSLSSAIALARARAGGRVLVVSTDPAHNLGHIWEQPVGDAATRVFTGPDGVVDALEIDPDATIERHFADVYETMRAMLPERLHRGAAQHLALARTAPGSHESAVLERTAEVLETGLARYDLVVFDTAPSGHTLHLLALPERLTGWAESLLAGRSRAERFAAAARGLVGGGGEAALSDSDARLRRQLQARRERFAAMHATVTDPAVAGFVVVTLAEALPVAETIEIARALGPLGIDLAGVVVNRRSPADAGAVPAARRAREDAHLRTLRSALPEASVAEVPAVDRDLTGVDALTELADLIARR